VESFDAKDAAKKDDIETAVLEFFKKNPNPEDDAFHTFAEELGVEPDELEDIAYEAATKWTSIALQGRANEKGFAEADADPKELAAGVKVEMEHTSDKEIAKRIALDHLSELPNYYTLLKKMESEGGVKESATSAIDTPQKLFDELDSLQTRTPKSSWERNAIDAWLEQVAAKMKEDAAYADIYGKKPKGSSIDAFVAAYESKTAALGLHIINNGPDKFFFVGTVPVDLKYEKRDGGELTQEEMKELSEASYPQMVADKIKAKLRVFKTESDAVAAADALGYDVKSKPSDKAFSVDAFVAAYEAKDAAKGHTAGTWSLPYTKAQAKKLAELVKGLREKKWQDISVDDVESALYPLYGDDALFDSLDALREDEEASGSLFSSIIKKALKEMLKHYKSDPEDFKDKFEPEALAILNKLIS
jgi:hypothetical protein